MGIPAWVGAAVQGGAGIGGGLIANAAANKRDHDSRNFNREQGLTEWQRQQEAWGLQNKRDDETWNRQNEYNMRLWNMENEYNSPAAQMRRYKEAGLNPHLIYGQSNTGGSISTSNLESGSNQGGTRPGNFTPANRDYSFIGQSGSFLSDMLAFREKSAQIDNLAEQNEVLREEANLKRATTASTLLQSIGYGISNKRSQFELDNQSDLFKTQMDAAKESIRRTRIEADVALSRNERESVSNAQSLRESAVRILQMRGAISNQQADTLLKGGQLLLQSQDYKLKQLDQGLKSLEQSRLEQGVPARELIERMLGRFLGESSKQLRYGPNRKEEWKR